MGNKKHSRMFSAGSGRSGREMTLSGMNKSTHKNQYIELSLDGSTNVDKDAVMFSASSATKATKRTILNNNETVKNLEKMKQDEFSRQETTFKAVHT